MSARSIRRAAERKALKLARKSGIVVPASNVSTAAAAPALEPSIAEIATEHISQVRLAANRENAQKSSGPKTLDGKAISCLNAVKTGLTGRTVLLPSDDADEYQRHTLAYERDLKPATQQERDLVHAIADCAWRLARIRSLEQGIFAKGRAEFADIFPEAEPGLRFSLIELHTFETYEKKLRNLSLQEARLSRQREKDRAQLRLLQQERKQQADLPAVAAAYDVAKRHGGSFDPAALGFEFSTEEIEAFLQQQSADSTQDFSYEAFKREQRAA